MSRASVNQVMLLGLEAATGLPVFPTRNLPALSVELERSLRNQFYRQMGKKYPTSGVRHREMSRGSFNGPLDFEEIIYPLAGLFGNYTAAQIGVTSGYTWTFDPKTSSSDSGKSFTCKYGDTSAADMAAGLVFNSLALELTQDDVRISGDCFAYALDNTVSPMTYSGANVITDEVTKIAITGGPTGGTFTITWSGQTTSAIAYDATAATVKAALQALSNIADADVEVYGGQLPASPVYVFWKGAQAGVNVAAPTTTDSLTGGSTPATAVTTEQAGAGATTNVTQQPVSISQFNIYLDSSYGSIGTTKYCTALEFGLNIPAKQEPVEVLCTTYPSFKDTVENPLEGASGRLVLVYEGSNLTLLNTLNTAAKPTYYLRAEAVGANIGASADYTFRADLAVKLSEPRERRNLNGVYAMEFGFQVVHDATMGGAMDFVVINTRTAL